MNSILATLLCVLVAPPLSVQTLDGEVVSGTFVAISKDTLRLTTGDGLRELPLSRLQQIEFTETTPATVTPAAWVQLVDGSTLIAASYVVVGKQATIQTVGGGQATLPVAAVRSVRFTKQNEQQQSEWIRIQQGRSAGDRLIVRKADRIDYLEGVMLDVDRKTVNFRLDNETIPVAITKLEGLIYYHHDVAHRPPAVLRVVDESGSVIEGARWSSEGDGLAITSPAGFVLSRRFDQILRIDFSSDRIIYLSELQPISVKSSPHFAARGLADRLSKFYRPRFDRPLFQQSSAFDDGKLQLANVAAGETRIDSYERGIAIHSRTLVTYELPENAKRFRALVGIDARVRELGHVRLVLSGDGRELFAAEMAGLEPPQELSVDVAGVRRFDVLVDYGKNQDIGDHLNLCNARIVK